jgi:glycosyltransferase involved in cell wall biosynthesis
LARQILDAGHTATFLLYGQESVSPESIEAMKVFWPSFYFVPHRAHNRVKSRGKYWGIDDWYHADLEAAVRFLSTQQEYDAVICEYVFFSKSLELFDNRILKILNCHDRMSGRAEMLLKNGIEPDFFFTTAEEEGKALDRADLILAIQAEEKKYFEGLTDRCVIEVGHPVEEHILPESNRPRLPIRIGYLGSNNSLNRKSIQLFLDAMKGTSGLAGKVKLVLAGSICSTIDDPAVDCLGFVDREEAFFHGIDLFINPMLDGTGLKIKTLSAIRHGVPVLATEAASAGIPVKRAEHRCTSMEELVQALQGVVAHPGRHLAELRQASLEVLVAYQARQAAQMNALLRAINTRSIRHLRRKRVLLVTDIPFWKPGMGSHARILALARSLEKRVSLDVFYFRSLTPEDLDSIAEAGMMARVVSFKDWEQQSAAFSFSSTINIHGLAQWRHEAWGRTLKAFLASRAPYDAAIIEYIRLGYLKDAFGEQVLTILDTHDLMAPREWRFATQGKSPSIRLPLADEIAVLDRFHAVMAIQSEEARWLQGMLVRAFPLCCPHGVDAIKDQPGKDVARTQRKGPLKLGFVGAASDANIEALRWFLAQVWPIVVRIPAELHVYGTVCARVQPAGHVFLHGLVESLGLAYQACDVMINPILFGGGLKIKSIEALAHGRPLITTPEGSVGIDRPEASGVIVARSRGEFVDAVIRLAHDEKLRHKMAVEALVAARAQFSPETCFRPLLEFVENA